MNSDDPILTRFEERLSQTGLSASTMVNYLADLRAFLRWGQQAVAPNFSLRAANQTHIRRYRHYLVNDLQRAATTVNRHLMALRKFFTFAAELGLIAADPTAGVALLQDNGQPDSPPLSEAEIEKLLQAAQHGSRAGLVRRDVAILQLLWYAGLRVSEVVDLQKDDLVFDHPGLHLEIGDKNKNRSLPLSGSVCQALNDYLQVRPQTHTTHIFLNQDGRPISQRTVQRIIGDCAKAAGLVGVSAQAMRRAFAHQLYDKTNDLALVSKRLGHQNISITEQYLSIH